MSLERYLGKEISVVFVDGQISRSDKYCLRSKREGWGEGSK